MDNQAQQYVSWISQTPDLTRDAILFFLVNSLYNAHKLDPQNAGKTVIFPERVAPNGRVKFSELPELLTELSRPYTELVTLARHLPAGKIESIFFQVCDTFWHENPQIPEYQYHYPADKVPGFKYHYPRERYNFDANILAEFTLPKVPTSHFTEPLRLALSVAYVHGVLENVNPEKISCVFDYKPGDKRVLPSSRLVDLIKQNKLTLEEYKDVKEKLRRADAIITSVQANCGIPVPPIADCRGYDRSLEFISGDIHNALLVYAEHSLLGNFRVTLVKH